MQKEHALNDPQTGHCSAKGGMNARTTRFPMLFINKSKHLSTPMRIYSLKPSAELYRQMGMRAIGYRVERMPLFMHAPNSGGIYCAIELQPSQLEERINNLQNGMTPITDGLNQIQRELREVLDIQEINTLLNAIQTRFQ